MKQTLQFDYFARSPDAPKLCRAIAFPSLLILALLVHVFDYSMYHSPCTTHMLISVCAALTSNSSKSSHSHSYHRLYCVYPIKLERSARLPTLRRVNMREMISYSARLLATPLVRCCTFSSQRSVMSATYGIMTQTFRNAEKRLLT